MNVAQFLRQTAENIRLGGFSPKLFKAPPGTTRNCFGGHMPRPVDGEILLRASRFLASVVDDEYYGNRFERHLRMTGWTEDATDDAAAACEIAADIAECHDI